MIRLSQFWGLLVGIEEVIREIPALNGALCPLITDQNRTTGYMEIVKRARGRLRAFSTFGASSRGNRPGGRATYAVRTSNSVRAEWNQRIPKRGFRSRRSGPLVRTAELGSIPCAQGPDMVCGAVMMMVLVGLLLRIAGSHRLIAVVMMMAVDFVAQSYFFCKCC